MAEWELIKKNQKNQRNCTSKTSQTRESELVHRGLLDWEH